MRNILKMLAVLSVLSFSTSVLAAVVVDSRIEQIEARRDAKIAKILDKMPAGPTRDALIAKTEASSEKLINRIESLPSES